jgi:hypothetical protein
MYYSFEVQCLTYIVGTTFGKANANLVIALIYVIE